MEVQKMKLKMDLEHKVMVCKRAIVMEKMRLAQKKHEFSVKTRQNLPRNPTRNAEFAEFNSLMQNLKNFKK